MDDFVLKEWHLVVIFLTILGSIFKNEITSTLDALIIIFEQRKLKGKSVFLLTPTGEWDEIMIIRYQAEIPFLRSGGVLVKHLRREGEAGHENFSFPNWKAQRIRFFKDG
ncbi:hypothetical protein MNBD_GAMMA11-2567 [hydrothermal vent metagenome]|uniref:Uncharacterized protein n=1 Tax=hydrothermal vent metagenome TaxID=652676 RepID=A0A3B0WSE9_9ZZZZ